MDLGESFDFDQPCSSQLISATDSEDSIMASTEPTVSIMQALFPSEDTIKNYLSLYENINKNDVYPPNNSSNGKNLDTDKFQLKTNHEFEPMQEESSYINSQDRITDICSSTLDQLRDDYHNPNLTNLLIDFIGNGNSEGSFVFQHDDRFLLDAEGNPILNHNDYINLKTNTLLLTKLGYKFTITINTDNDKVKQIWDSNVGQKILSAFYSPLGLKGNYLSKQVILDQFEALVLKELIKAFQTEPTVPSDFVSRYKINPSPAQFITNCAKIKSFKKLCNNDKILILSNTIFNFISWKAVYYYDPSIDGWKDYDKLIERRDCFIWNRKFHDAIVSEIERLPDKWRYDLTIDVLVTAIIIFNSDQDGLKYDEIVRQEQFLYIFLLQRYLESVCKSPCEVSDNLYRLMVCAERCKDLGKLLCAKIEDMEIGCIRRLQQWFISRINR